MKALVFNKFGKPEDIFSIQETPTPKPKADEVLVKMLLSPVHHHDFSAAKGLYGQFRPFPITGGSEAVGIIQACGENVKDLKEGQKIITAAAPGAWAEYFTLPASEAFPIDNGLSDQQAAQLATMPLDALLLFNFLNVQSGDWVIQNGANGVIGKVLGALAKERGVHVVNLVRSQKSKTELEKTGLENIIETSAKDWKKQVESVAGDKLKAGIDVLGGQASADLMELLGHNSLLVSFGQIADKDMIIPSGPLILKSVTVKGFFVGPVLEKMSKAEKVKALQGLGQEVLSGKLSLPTGGIYNLDHFDKALKEHHTPGRTGRVLLKA